MYGTRISLNFRKPNRYRIELQLILFYLLLKGKDMSNTTKNWLSNTSLCLVAYSYSCVEALVFRNMQKQLRHITSSEHFVHCGKMSRALFRVKVRCKYTLRCTLPPQKLARPTRSTAAIAATTTIALLATSTAVPRAHLGLAFLPFFHQKLSKAYWKNKTIV
ncbi:hypothetical protein SDJN02_20825, partial [Cucurbita argyrosperma subsp. argyrosperma]